MTRIFLIRHGKPVEEARGRCYGRTDFSLSPEGHRQMEQVAQQLANEPIAAVYTSPLTRARESAAAISNAAQVIPGLSEINFGEFEGLTYDEIALRYPDIYNQWMTAPTEVRFPGGENLADMRRRVLRAFQSICVGKEGQTIAIVSHGGVNRILIAWANKLPDTQFFDIPQDYGIVNLIELTD